MEAAIYAHCICSVCFLPNSSLGRLHVTALLMFANQSSQTDRKQIVFYLYHNSRHFEYTAPYIQVVIM